MEDRKIVSLYWMRAEDAIEESNAKYGPYCSSIAYGILRDLRDTEECVSDTWLRAWESMPPQKPDRLGAFLGKITRNLALDRYRKKNAIFRGGGQVTLAAEELMWCIPAVDPVSDLTGQLDLTASLERFLQNLSKEKRRVFLLRYWYFQSIHEISEQLSVSKSKVLSMLHRTRAELKDHLQKEGIQV